MKRKSFIFCISLAIVLASCRTSRNDLEYFTSIRNETAGVLQTEPYTTTIEPESELVIIVKSEVPEASAEFNLPYINPALSGSTDANVQSQMQTYKVDNKGNIDFPVLGSIHVAGMTTYELKDYLQKRISQYVKDPIVTVTLSSYRIVVMGEVKNPQTILTSADRFSVLDALAEAGDLTDFARRDNILVLRRISDTEIEYHRVDLHKADITKDKFFWLKNNDVVVVSPNNVKEDNSKYNQNNAFKLSVISTVVGMSTAVISLIIALAIR